MLTESLRRKLWANSRPRAADAGIDERTLHQLIVRGHKNRLNAPTPMPRDETRAEQKIYIQRLRDRHGLHKQVDPRIIVYDAIHRLRRW
jgi:hypothetical protein